MRSDLTGVRQAMDDVVAPHDLLAHPFYQRWSEGSLTLEDLRFYSTQYWRQVESFPGNLQTLAARCDGQVQGALEDNAADEVEGDHPGLWRAFAEALGATDEVLEGTPAEPQTETCVRRFTEVCATGSVPFALGMLYGYESQTPRVATTKVEALTEHYGIDGAPAEYFRVHAFLDVEHRAALADAIESVTEDDPEARREAIAGAEAGARAISTLLDGVERVVAANHG
ncbi:MAG: iron-containing redox enzyme family protein [Actinomycetota bacterium]|nr:iron-containing redox enzyme family protein [Actinomycetota bacterium]